MRRLLVTLLALVLLFALCATAVGAQPAGAPWIGRWEAIDVDGSYMTLAVSGGVRGAVRLNYRDYGASICGTDDAGVPLYAATINAVGGVTAPNTLEGQGPLRCLAAPAYIHEISPVGMRFEYDPATDTMWDGWVIWERQ